MFRVTPCAEGTDTIVNQLLQREPAAMRELTMENMAAFNQLAISPKGTHAPDNAQASVRGKESDLFSRESSTAD